MLVSEQAAIAKSSSAYSTLISGLANQGKLSNDNELTERIQQISNRLISQAVKFRPEAKNWQWSINVIDDTDVVNAWCMAGGKMAIYTGLITKLEPTDDEIAQILAHEISHAISNHVAEKMSMQIASAVAVATVTAMSKSRNHQAVRDVSDLAAKAIITLPNSREAEYEADKIGIQLASQAGYNPHAAVTLWEKMMRVTGSTSRFDFLATHPASPKRLEALAELEKIHSPTYLATNTDLKSIPTAWTNSARNNNYTKALASGGASPSSAMSLTAQRLREISKLKAEGIITESDFQSKKMQLLDEY